MASKHKTFLIRDKKGREAIMRLPVNQYGGVTHKAHEMIGQRFYDGTTGERGRMQYALCIEAYSTGENLIKALQDYQKNII